MVASEVELVHIDAAKLLLMGKEVNFITDSCLGKTAIIHSQLITFFLGVDCENFLGNCLTCKGQERITELEIMEAEGSEMIDSQKCVGKLETLEEMGKLCITILR